ncbi:MAG: transglutaminase domain-containing protein [Ruminococcaceae bacterium]|nr:transglutaminase domain-containing protein [Oscillospiraceae bacterium]
MNRISDKKLKGRKKKNESLQQRIVEAQTKKAKMRTETTLEAVTVSPAENMSTGNTVFGLVLRTLVIFLGVFGLNLFLFDAIRLVNAGETGFSNITVETSFVAVLSLLITVLCVLFSLQKHLYFFTPIAAVGGLAVWLFATQSNPIGFLFQAGRRLFNLLCENMRYLGYATYMQYVKDTSFSFDEEKLVHFATACVIVISGLILGMAIAKRVRAFWVTIVCAIYMVPVFVFNITSSNIGLALALSFLCGAIALYVSDCLYGGVFAARKAAKLEKKQAKAAKKQAKKDKKIEKRSIKNDAIRAYNKELAADQPRSKAKKAKKAVLLKAKKDKEDRIKAAKIERIEAKKAAKIQKKEAKKAAALEKKLSRRKIKEEKTKLSAREKAAKKSKNSEELAAIAEIKKEIRAKNKSELILKVFGKPKEMKIRASSGFAGGMAVVIAFLALWIPLVFVQRSFPKIDVIDRPMQIARTYVTAYLMGDDIDLNSLAMYGGVSELNPRVLNFETPQYKGQPLFRVETDHLAPVYLRSWIGTQYDSKTDKWSSADYDTVNAYRDRFGYSYTPDSITYNFNKYVHPKALDINVVNQYRNLVDYGWNIFQVHVQRLSGTSRLIFVPSTMNSELGIMDFNSLEKTSMRYTAHFDGIYSSRFFEEGISYSVSSANPIMKDKNLGVNLENSIEYYNILNDYLDTVDAIEKSISSALFFSETREYTYDTPLGEINLVGDDLTFLAERFEAETEKYGLREEDDTSIVEKYILMSKSERQKFQTAFDTELSYRYYAGEYYTTSFGSQRISDLADEILANAGIVKGEKQTVDMSQFEGMTEDAYKRLSAEKKYGNYYESWFTDSETGEVIPRHHAVLAVIEYLRDNYKYTLDPNCPQTPLLDEEGNPVLDEEGNPVTVDYIEGDSNLEAFLFDIKEGYCVHFATSAVAILREMGFAARYAEGYIATDYSSSRHKDAVAMYQSSVRDYDAHAWVEVYYPAIGWMTYEATPPYCKEIYDDAKLVTSSGDIDQNKVTVPDEKKEEEARPLFPDKDDSNEEKEEEEFDFTPLIIAASVIVGVYVIFQTIWAILRWRANRANNKRRDLINSIPIDGLEYKEKVKSGEIDVHKTARELTDYVFEIFSALGCLPEKGELPTEFAMRLDNDYANLSDHKVAEVMVIIEKEEFGGKLNYHEISILAGYLRDIQCSVYAGLSLKDKFRMRYIMNVI